MTQIKAKVYCNGNNYCTNDIDIGNTAVTNYTIKENDIDYLNIFQDQHIVPDVWRYTIKVSNGNIQIFPIVKTIKLSDFSDRLAIDAIGSKTILLILESPHKDEYEPTPTDFNSLKPIAPAQGNQNPGQAGGGIKKHLHIVLRKVNLEDGFYSLVIANPIPYQCSLACMRKFDRKICDNVWEGIWEVKDDEIYVVQENFIARYSMYQPVYTINCCTGKLSNHVTNLLLKHNCGDNLYKTTHPALTWNTKQYNLSINKI